MNSEEGSPPPSVRVEWTREGWGVFGLAGLLAATVLMPTWQPNPLAAALGLGLALTLGWARWWAPRALRNVRGTWVLPTSVHALDEVTVGASLVAPDGSPALLIEAWQPTPRRFEMAARLAGLDAQSTRCAWRTVFPKRGRHWLPALTASTTQPFGLFRARVRLGAGTEVVVFPPLGRLRRELELRIERWLETQALTRDPGADEPAQLRAYRAGDHPHAIHWKASARRRALLVLERHAAGCRSLALVVDTSAGAPAWKVERLIAIAATLVDYFCVQHWAVTLHGFFAPDGLSTGRAGLMEALALAGPQSGNLRDHSLKSGQRGAFP